MRFSFPSLMLWTACWSMLGPGALPRAIAADPRPVVEVEDEVYTFESANNGAGPSWCHGSTCLVRIGDDVFASGLETLQDAKPLNNCRWMLFHRTAAGWRRAYLDAEHRTREPAPVAAFAGGPLFVSANPTLLTDRTSYSGPARPEILRFDPAAPAKPAETLLPQWAGKPAFTEHSYRSFAADGPGRELVLLQNIDYTHAEWSFRDRDGRWAAQGKLVWPWGAEYDTPQPIRVCYPNVALAGRRLYFCGVSDIVEPYAKWRLAKKKITGQNWDFDFRRLFFTWSKDITAGKFEPWVEITGRDKTCGWIMPGDLWVAPDGDVHILWTERAIDERLRKEFFPDAKQSHTFGYAVVRDGKVALRRAVVELQEGQRAVIASAGRFHATPDGRLFVIYFAAGTDAAGKSVSENRLVEVLPGGTFGKHVPVPLKRPFGSFFTATVRAGSAPSNILDILGHATGAGSTVSYARVRIE